MIKFFVSIKHSSVLRKFTILFLLVSIIPLSLLTYIYFQLKLHPEMMNYIPNLQLALTLTIIGIGIGYLAIRGIINEFIHVGDSSRSSLTAILGPQSLVNTAGEGNEISTLTQTFSEVKQRLEKDIQELKLARSTLHSVLSKVSRASNASSATTQEMDTFLQLIIDTATDAFLGKAGFLLLIDKKNEELYVKSMAGTDRGNFKEKRIKINDNIWAKVINSKLPMSISKEELAYPLSHQTDFLEAPFLCSPLSTNDGRQGLFVISGRKIPENYQEEDRNLIYTVALQTAAILNNREMKN